jgi:hypothetical protein
MKIVWVPSFFIFLTIISACSPTGRLVVNEVSENTVHVKTINFVQLKPTIDVDPKLLAVVQDEVEGHVLEDEVFSRGNELTLSYRIVQYEPGSRAARYFSVGQAGEGSITIDATFTDDQGAVLAKVQATGEIRSGTFGGGSNNSIENAADVIGKYARKHFKPGP